MYCRKVVKLSELVFLTKCREQSFITLTSAALETFGDEGARLPPFRRQLLNDLLHVVGIQHAQLLVGVVNIPVANVMILKIFSPKKPWRF
jgi:hypothetical protein